MKTLKAIAVWLLWLLVTSIIALVAIWYGTGEEVWFSGEVQGHQVEQYFGDK